MALTLLEASKATGLSKSALLKAVKSGRLSAHRDSLGGSYSVDPAELFRVYPPVAKLLDVSSPSHTGDQILEEKVRGLERQVYQLEGERNDLRQRLDAESEERRKLTALLTDPRTSAHPPVPQVRTPYILHTISTFALVAACVAVWLALRAST